MIFPWKSSISRDCPDTDSGFMSGLMEVGIPRPTVTWSGSGDASAIRRERPANVRDLRSLRRCVVDVTGGGGPWRHLTVEKCEKKLC